MRKNTKNKGFRLNLMEESDKNIISYLEKKLEKQDIDLNALIIEIQTKFSKKAASVSIGHILRTKTNIKLLDKTIRLANVYLDKNNLSSLVDFILRPNNDNNFLNLKVLAIKAMAKYKDKSVVPSLLFCLNDKSSNYKIKLAAADALGKIGDKNAFETLGKIATDEEEQSAYIKETAVTALGMLGDDRAIEVFSYIMDTKQIFKEKFSFLKEKIMEAMDKFDISKNKKALDIIKKSLYDTSPNVRISALEALMNSNSSESYSLIYDILKYDNDIEVRKNALAALYNISDKAIINKVITDNYPNELKEYAYEILREIEEDENE